MTPIADLRSVPVQVDQAHEDLEFWYPKLRLEEEKMRVVVAGPGRIRCIGMRGYPCTPADPPGSSRALVAALDGKATV